MCAIFLVLFFASTSSTAAGTYLPYESPRSPILDLQWVLILRQLLMFLGKFVHLALED
ncbi:hypothetical protein RchiOBHm_Chr3g0482441 [Rosa chinensis]|uniref:Uncharacterized protein n=1 Tax=Rosa chinensis TaxID=74649 RepID=A0A2P6RE71_ROSCH|nr:hypothetical protein RchiOBHm_Chr3g0482441 [Rosa chinensis]